MIGPVIRAASVNAVARSYHLQLFGRQMIQKRNSGPWYYRDLPPHDKRLAQLANGAMCFMWAWITYHCCTDYGHLFGHYSVQDPNTMTDEQLGVVWD
ncbi:uncharacterized protein LOC111259351 [Varroa jacobsoni]|uniref:uncharacterized protein LOC111259351 n=1 Tax=Varroa jacobsoni TaxID=62625 RepID=UPI000BFA11D6|nr:uncharacterized protein LOC111259351 [Varroa jacobsoni]